jgi:integrase
MAVAASGGARINSEFTAKSLQPRTAPFKVPDAIVPGLRLRVDANGGKYWVLRIYSGGRETEVGVGTFTQVGRPDRVVTGLRAARDEALRLKALAKTGVDLAARRQAERDRSIAERDRAALERQQAREARVQARKAKLAEGARNRATLAVVSDAWIEAMAPGWTADHRHQVEQSFRDHVLPVMSEGVRLGGKPIDAIAPVDVVVVVQRLLGTGEDVQAPRIETCKRVTQRLGALFEHATLHHQLKLNPVVIARPQTRLLMRGARKLAPKRNFPAVPTAELPELLRAMKFYGGDLVTRAALWTLAFTFVRTGELRGARWSEFELDGPEPTWTIPAARMKIKQRGDMEADPHTVPLAPQVVELLRELRRVNRGELVFAQSRKADSPISENTVLYALAGMGYQGRMTGHGFRAVASTMLHEAGWPPGAIEQQLAHSKSDAVVGAYDRSQHLATRRAMMTWYAATLNALRDGTPTPAVPLRDGRFVLPLRVVGEPQAVGA